MNNLFDMMMQAQGGQAMQNLARQFGLAPEQAQSAVAAMLPAFQVGAGEADRKHQQLPGDDEDDGRRTVRRLSRIGAADRIPDEAAEQGKDVLGQLFGAKEVSRAVAAQAAAMSGISDTIIKQMLPVVASMLMGGLFKGAMNNGLFGQGMPGGFGNMMGQQQAPGAMFANNPFGAMIGQMMSGMMGQKPAPQDPMSAGMEMLRGMFDSGQQIQRSQMDAFQSIFAQFSGRR